MPSAGLSGGGTGTDPAPQNGAPPRPRSPLWCDSGSDSDAERPDPDLVLDDLAGRRFRGPSPAAVPPNFSVPLGPMEPGRIPAPPRAPMAGANAPPLAAVTSHRSENGGMVPVFGA